MCPTEIVAFSNAVDDFAAINTKVVAVSTDSKFTHLQWVRTPRDQGGLGPVKLPLIADVSKDISRAYGMLVEDPEDELYGAALRYEARAREFASASRASSRARAARAPPRPWRPPCRVASALRRN